MNLINNPAAFAEARDFVISAKASFTLLAVGSPVQEMLARAIAQHPDATGTGLCIGGALEFFTKIKARAPLWMQHAGLEWFHRLMHEPGRLARRYLFDDPPTLAALFREAARQAVRGRNRAAVTRSRPKLEIGQVVSIVPPIFGDRPSAP